MHYLFFDTETTGTNPHKDRLVQLAFLLADQRGNKILELSQIVRPEGFIIPNADFHGISTQKALQEGESLQSILSDFIAMLEDADHLIGHNIQFDKSILANELLHNRAHPNHLKRLQNLPSTCTMWAAKTLLGKRPKLQELHQYLFRQTFQNAHNALADVRATARCFFELRHRQIIAA